MLLQDVFESNSKDLIKSLLERNCPVFVSMYGATGSGKTFTMLETKTYPGIYLTMVELYKEMDAKKPEKDFDLSISYLYTFLIRKLLDIFGGSERCCRVANR